MADGLAVKLAELVAVALLALRVVVGVTVILCDPPVVNMPT